MALSVLPTSGCTQYQSLVCALKYLGALCGIPVHQRPRSDSPSGPGEFVLRVVQGGIGCGTVWNGRTILEFQVSGCTAAGYCRGHPDGNIDAGPCHVHVVRLVTSICQFDGTFRLILLATDQSNAPTVDCGVEINPLGRCLVNSSPNRVVEQIDGTNTDCFRPVRYKYTMFGAGIRFAR